MHFTLVCLCALLLCLCTAHTIKHVVVLMEENRSFDHLLGFRKGVNGLTGQEFNYINPSKPWLGKVFVQQNASNVAPCDPDHSFPATTMKIFGYEAYHTKNFTNPTMSGFVNFEGYLGRADTDYCEVMNSVSVEHLPVMNSLADEFLLFDQFYASMPGPTWPNRVFFLCGTSGGLTETINPWYKGQTGVLFPQKTIFDQMTESGRKWKNYVNDTPWELFIESVAKNPENVVLMDEFFEDCRQGTLPDFSFINPRAGVNLTLGLGSNDMHPDHDVALGEAFYKDIYEALRASPAWNDTLFIVTFDEHGGFYDHVPTPLDVPSPGDNISSYPDLGFDFERLGLRIPTLLISPWIPKGVVESFPSNPSKPASNSQYELTSIMATVRKIFNMTTGPLTKRDAWAATFEHLLSLDEPRTDCPMHLPDPMPPTMSLETEASKPLNGLQKHIAHVHGHLSGLGSPTHIREQREISGWMQQAFAVHKASTLAWKASKVSAQFTARCEPFIGMSPNYIASNWTVDYDNSIPYRTVSVLVTDNSTNTTYTYCLDSNTTTLHGETGVSLCYPSAQASTNQDPQQQWVLLSDATLRPYTQQNLCLTNQCINNQNYITSVTLEECSGSLAQRWGYMGPAVGNMGWADEGILAEGSAIYALVVDAKGK